MDIINIFPYDASRAVSYAKRWALGRNPDYYNYDGVGGDCTNYVSQCIYAGSQVMNETPIYGWYYYTASNRTASWTGVAFLHDFLVNNQSIGPFGHAADKQEMVPGDVIQLGRMNGDFYHSLFVLETYPKILVAAHTSDALFRPLLSYQYDFIRYIHIDGVRK